MSERKPKVIVVAGPTASGKSDLALALAQALGGVIINADSQQRYRDFPILTAQPTARELARAPHRLFGDLEAHEISTAAEWADKAAAEIRAANSRERVPIVVGGTGLYLRVLMQGVAAIPPIPDDVRAAGRALLADIGNEAFHLRLAARDPAAAARIPVGNTQRLARAWEVVEATGTPLSVWQQVRARPAVDAAFFSILIMPPRETIVAACAARFEAMLAAGALAEVQRAQAKQIPREAPAMNALGARELADYLSGRLDRPQAIAAAEVVTRQYAKRQATWFRHQFNSNLTLEARYTDDKRTTVVGRVGEFLKELQ
ncbi:MAG: tRNA (adenosine(37)-N6)-dimethylallyltransferase MiaA [Rhodospirillaceae bacterium]